MGIIAVFFMGVVWIGGCFIDGTLAGHDSIENSVSETSEESRSLLDGGKRVGYSGTAEVADKKV